MDINVQKKTRARSASYILILACEGFKDNRDNRDNLLYVRLSFFISHKKRLSLLSLLSLKNLASEKL